MLFGNLAKRTLILFCLAAAATWSSCRSEDDDPDITASEDLFINEISAAGDDWVELFNKSAASRDLTGYKIYDDPANKYTLPAGTSIAANGYLVLFCNDGNSGLNTNFKLTSLGETVWLENAGGDVIDKVTFPALEKNQSYARFPDGEELEISGNPTEGQSNGSASASSILSENRQPLVPGLAESVTVQAVMSSSSGIASVKLLYRFNNSAFTSVDMTQAGNIYSGVIPAMNATGLVEYYIEAKNTAGVTTRHPASAPAKFHDYLLNTDPLPELVINEFMAQNTSCCADNSSGVPEYDDWIEIYNAGDEPVPIAGLYLSDDITNPFNSKISESSTITIQPGGYLVIWADGQEEQGELHVDFSLLQSGEAVGLYYKDGRKIDEILFGAVDADKSIGRVPNGSGDFQLLSSPSKGAANN